MTKYQKETLKYSLEEEQKILNTLKRDYKEAGKTIESRIKNLMKRDDADLIHVIHQVNYQKALKTQINDVLDKLNDGTYSSIQKYMEDSYGTGFTSSLYRLQKQGVPLIFPMNREEILRAVQTNSKISKRKYGKNFTKMKNTIRNEVTRGISTSMSFGDIARNIDNTMKSGLYNSYRVARTEGHRINQEASFDAMNKAKEAGADVVKKWDSTLDSRTRPHHSQLDGQIRELEDPFEVAGLEAMYPSGFGVASEDINCRCVVLEIGRWELDEDDTYSKFDGDSGTIVSDLSNTKNYEEFREKYNIEVKKVEETPTVSISELESRQSIIEKDLESLRSELKYKERDIYMARFLGNQDVDSIQISIDTLKTNIDDLEKELAKLKKDIESHPNYVFKSESRKSLEKAKIDYLEVRKLDKALDEPKIISRIAGGDKTSGSCASVALAYAGQKCGVDVLDFRGGNSMDWFSSKLNKIRMWDDLGVTYTVGNKFKGCSSNGALVLKSLETGKEYYLSVGRHASIVRKNSDGVIQYLELQSNQYNGWKNFSNNILDTLKYRFGCGSLNGDAYLTDISQLKDNEEFYKILGYINTAESAQRRGSDGNIK